MEGMASGTTTRRTSAPALHAEGARRLDHPLVDVAHAVRRVEVHREQRGQADQRDLGRLTDAEPNDEEEDDGGVGDHAQHLHGGVEELLTQPGQADHDAEDEADAGAEGEPEGGPPGRDPDVTQKIVVVPQLHERVPGGRWCRERVRGDGAGAGEDPPGGEDGDGHEKAQRDRPAPRPPPDLADRQPDQPRHRRRHRGSRRATGCRSLWSERERTRMRRLEGHEIPAALSTVLLNGRSKTFLTLIGVVRSPSLRNVLASACW